MEFDSHMSGVVTATVAIVNALTPGWAKGREYTPDPDGLAELAHQALRYAAAPGRPEPTDTQARGLTECATRLRVVFEYLEDGDMDAACEHVNGLLATTGAAPVLSNHDGGPWHLHFHAAGFVRGWEAAMATALAVVLGNPHADRLGVCSAAGCDRVYVDTSRNGTRRFCSTACQNRIKAAQFRQRHAVGDDHR